MKGKGLALHLCRAMTTDEYHFFVYDKESHTFFVAEHGEIVGVDEGLPLCSVSGICVYQWKQKGVLPKNLDNPRAFIPAVPRILGPFVLPSSIDALMTRLADDVGS